MDSVDHVDLDIKPYMFEPVVETITRNDRSSDSDSFSENEADESLSTDHSNGSRAGNTDWCDCGCCKAMTTDIESVCCTEIAAISSKSAELDLDCITSHEAFQMTCLNRYCVELGIYSLIENDGPLDDNEPMNETYRYVAYRQFVQWIWHRLGRHNRRVLPSCVVCKIRDTYPDPNNVYVGFKYIAVD